MQCLFKIILIVLVVCGSLLQTSEKCYGQAKNDNTDDAALNDLVIQGDSTTVSADDEVVVIEDDSAEAIVERDVF
jgi:hypothetical protein